MGLVWFPEVEQKVAGVIMMPTSYGIENRVKEILHKGSAVGRPLRRKKAQCAGIYEDQNVSPYVHIDKVKIGLCAIQVKELRNSQLGTPFALP